MNVIVASFVFTDAVTLTHIPNSQRAKAALFTSNSAALARCTNSFASFLILIKSKTLLKEIAAIMKFV